MEASAAVRRIAIIGASTGGASAAEALRRAGFDGAITLIGDEPDLPYERPQLSKNYLLREDGAEQQVYLRPREYYEQQRVSLRLGVRASGLDAPGYAVLLEDGEHVPYDRLIIATGCAPVRLRIPGSSLPGIHYLRTLADARALAATLRADRTCGGRVVVVGAGFIGSEVAAACRMLGIDVTLLDILAAPLERVLGSETGALYAEMHRAHGVRLRLGEGVVAFHGADRVEAVETTSGERIACSTVVVGIGVRPATEWLNGSGLALEDGILVNAQCETSVPGIFAIGDVARWPYHQTGTDDIEFVRLEHWDNALRQGDIAAQNTLGRGLTFSSVPYFWSDQYDLRLQYVGHATGWDAIVVRGNPATQSYIAFYLTGELVRAAFAVNRVRDLVALKRLVGQRPDRMALADDAVPLKSLISSPPAR